MNTRYLSLKPLIPLFNTKRPIPWDQMFERPAGLEVEIGCGLGDFLVRNAREFPDKNFVGIDPAWISVKGTLRKIALSRVANARLLRADARMALERLFPENTIDAVCALFPCPWPKNRHSRHRLFSNSFLKLLNSRLVPEGEMLIVTDHRDFFEWMQSQVEGTGFTSIQSTVSPRFGTKYEKKWLQSGQKIFFQLRLQKRRHIRMPVKEDFPLIAHIVESFNPETFRPMPMRGHITLQFKEMLYDPKRLKGLVHWVVIENELLQHVWVEILKKEDGWHIRPARGTNMIPTAGVQKALDRVKEGIGE